jgi:hypothetical protein
MLDLQLLPKGPSPKGNPHFRTVYFKTLHFHNQSKTCIMFGFSLLAIRVSAKPTAQAPYPPPNTLVAQPPTTRLIDMAKLGCSPCS